MSDTAAIFALVLTVAALLFLIAAILTKAWQDGDLKADLKFVRGYIRIYVNHAKNRFIRN